MLPEGKNAFFGWLHGFVCRVTVGRMAISGLNENTMQAVGVILIVASGILFLLPGILEILEDMRCKPAARLKKFIESHFWAFILWMLLTASAFMAGMSLSGGMDALDKAFPARTGFCPARHL